MISGIILRLVHTKLMDTFEVRKEQPSSTCRVEISLEIRLIISSMDCVSAACREFWLAARVAIEFWFIEDNRLFGVSGRSGVFVKSDRYLH